ncbi:GNAT family N-acetyltransferase [Paraliobacillus sp. PM-2]|uniref:GNAT family N-acetyltransferase n=1 Tax=Paraliobacillus sp. PM-2 TaxID=1462524 RepID=UPI000B85F5F8|nr:GNAT family N-acetyltransferase [Paraliobacillus sp. PM-2]
MKQITIEVLETEEELKEAFPIVQELRGHLDEQQFLALVQESQVKHQYQMLALYYKGKIAAVIGFKPMITLYYGRFVWICDLVTTTDERSKGFGDMLLSYVEDWAKERHYQAVALSSGLQRTDAHRFYEEKMGYDSVSYVFKKDL